MFQIWNKMFQRWVLIWPSYNKNKFKSVSFNKNQPLVHKSARSWRNVHWQKSNSDIQEPLFEPKIMKIIIQNLFWVILTILMCVFILQWLAAESSDCSSEGSEGSHHHSWPRGPRRDLPPNSTLGVFLRGRRNSPSFHLENET